MDEDAWLFDAVTDDGVGISARLAWRPTEGRVRWWTYVVRPDTGPVVVRDHDVSPPRGAALEIRADGLWAALVCETPLEHWSLGLEAFGIRLDDPEDGRHGELGHRVPVGLDVEWELTGPPVGAPWAGRWSAAGFAQPGRVHGEVLLGSERLAIDAVARRTRAWGATPWPAGWVRSWWAAVEDATVHDDVMAGVDDLGDGRVLVPLDASVDGGVALERRVLHGVRDGRTMVGWSELLLTE